MCKKEVKLIEESIENFITKGESLYVKGVVADKYSKPYVYFLSLLYLKIVNYRLSGEPVLVARFVNKYISDKNNELSIKILRWCDKNDITLLDINRERFKEIGKGWQSITKRQIGLEKTISSIIKIQDKRASLHMIGYDNSPLITFLIYVYNVLLNTKVRQVNKEVLDKAVNSYIIEYGTMLDMSIHDWCVTNKIVFEQPVLEFIPSKKKNKDYTKEEEVLFSNDNIRVLKTTRVINIKSVNEIKDIIGKSLIQILILDKDLPEHIVNMILLDLNVNVVDGVITYKATLSEVVTKMLLRGYLEFLNAKKQDLLIEFINLRAYIIPIDNSISKMENTYDGKVKLIIKHFLYD